MQVTLESVSYIYGRGTPLERLALSGIDLSVAPGSSVAIVGATGSGKSTLLRLIAGLLPPTGGSVLLDGFPAAARGRKARERRLALGVAFQRPEDQLFAETVALDAAFGPRNRGLSVEAAAERASAALALVGLAPDSFGERSPFALSGGEMRRAALAGVFALDPEVLLLDEPSAGLDPRGKAALEGILATWRHTTGATLILVTHDLSEAARLAGRIVVLKDGRIEADGPAGTVAGNPDLLAQAALEPPEPVGVLARLRARGWPVGTAIADPAAAAQEIARAWKAGGAAAGCVDGTTGEAAR